MEEMIDKSLLEIKKDEKISNIGNKLSDFIILQVLGEGEYGFTAKVRSKLNLRIYALKKYKSEFFLNNDDINNCILKQIIFMKKLDHENVVKLYNYFYEEGDLYMVMEYMERGCIYELIRAYMDLNIKIEEEKLWIIFEQCLKGLVYLHGQGLIHRDIKPVNLLINNKDEIKYCNFYMSAIVDPYKISAFTKDKIEVKNLLNLMIQVDSGKYMAPEINDESNLNIENGLKVDVYSLGKIFSALAFFDLDFPDNEKLNSLGYSKELIQIIREMVEINPSKRPSSQQIYKKFIKFYI